MPDTTFKHRTFDARPDRIDLRDRVYQPKLESLPHVFPARDFIKEKMVSYSSNLVLDQGSEGACTGFGLAATINFLLWRKNKFETENLNTVSPRMLYHLARIYDEWPGEDYSGSSCRGAMRGWHRHGVCSDVHWPYRNPQGKVAFVQPEKEWELNAALCPLGAYYRINKDSISDMQAAINEVGAIYASANVHEGWFLGTTTEPALIKYPRKKTGGHAFCIGGYNSDGFLVQNSWGPDWGYHGFAFMSYADWVENGSDAWVAVLGAPMRNAQASATFSSMPSSDVEFGKSTWFGKGATLNTDFPYQSDAVKPETEEWAYQHSLVLGNNGRPINKLIAAENAGQAVEEICYRRPMEFFEGLPTNSRARLVVFVHGGLNSEEDSIKRIRVMGPYFRENGIHPLFITWRTGLMESIEGIVTDSFRSAFQAEPGMPDEAFFDSVKRKLKDARDRSIEVACENLLVKPIWSEMKQNAESAAKSGGGIRHLISQLLKLNTQVADLEIHLIGHSAGSIVLGHFLSGLRKRLKIESISLWAPACTAEFANDHYAKAQRQGLFEAESLHVDNLDDEREKADDVGPYGKSLLYLVSRALETRHKTPLIGMEHAWPSSSAPEDQWNDDKSVTRSLREWSKFTKHGVKVRWHKKSRKYIFTGLREVRLGHGTFDNDIEVFEKTLKRIRRGKLLVSVDNLDY